MQARAQACQCSGGWRRGAGREGAGVMRRVRTTLLFLSVALGSAAAVWLGLAALAGYVASTPAAPSPPPQESGETAARGVSLAEDEVDLDDDVDGNAEDARAHAQMLALRGQASHPARESVGPQGGGAAAPVEPQGGGACNRVRGEEYVERRARRDPARAAFRWLSSPA